MKNVGTVLGIILIVILVLLLLGGVGMMGFGGFGMGGMMNGYGGMMGGRGGIMGGYGFNPIGSILSLLFWALIIGGIVLLVVWLVRNANTLTASQRNNVGESPLDILKARYAKGEITKEQFDAIKQDLSV